MRLTIEQIRAGAAQARRWIEHVGDLYLGNVSYRSGAYVVGLLDDRKLWGGAGGSACCPAGEMGDDGVSNLGIYGHMTELVRYSIGMSNTLAPLRMSDVADAFDPILAAADLTERRAAQAKARREEFEMSRVVLLEEVMA